MMKTRTKPLTGRDRIVTITSEEEQSIQKAVEQLDRELMKKSHNMVMNYEKEVE